MNLINKGFAIGASVLTGSVLALSASSAQAADITPITVGAPTTVDFNFVGSNGLFLSELGVYNYSGSTPTFLGTILLREADPGFGPGPDFPGTAVGPGGISSSTYTFAPGTYALGLASFLDGAPTTTVFYGPTNSKPDDEASLFTGTVISFEDNGGSIDFNDFRFTATTRTSVPEPTTLAGLGLVAGALVFSRRRKVTKTL